jgi:hypothetical protein
MEDQNNDTHRGVPSVYEENASLSKIDEVISIKDLVNEGDSLKKRIEAHMRENVLEQVDNSAGTYVWQRGEKHQDEPDILVSEFSMWFHNCMGQLQKRDVDLTQFQSGHAYILGIINLTTRVTCRKTDCISIVKTTFSDMIALVNSIEKYPNKVASPVAVNQTNVSVNAISSSSSTVNLHIDGFKECLQMFMTHMEDEEGVSNKEEIVQMAKEMLEIDEKEPFKKKWGIFRDKAMPNVPYVSLFIQLGSLFLGVI